MSDDAKVREKLEELKNYFYDEINSLRSRINEQYGKREKNNTEPESCGSRSDTKGRKLLEHKRSYRRRISVRRFY